MQDETKDKLLDWVQNNLIFFLDSKYDYFCLDLSQKLNEEANLKDYFIVCETYDDLLRNYGTFEESILIVIDDRIQGLSVHRKAYFEDYLFTAQGLVLCDRHIWVSRNCTIEQLRASAAELAEFLSK